MMLRFGQQYARRGPLGRRSADKKGQPKKADLLHLGGDEEDRNPDLRIANATLSQLSYVPENGHSTSFKKAVQLAFIFTILIAKALA